MKKWISRTIDGVLGAFIIFLVGCQIGMLVSAKNNFNVPTLFGKSFMRVITDSMEVEPGTEITRGDFKMVVDDPLKVGTGIIVSKVDVKDIKVGDCLTFYDEALASRYNLSNAVVTHRVITISQSETTGKYTFYCYGDNSNAMTCPSEGCVYPNSQNVVPEENVIGVVTGHSDAFGGFLGVVQSTWFVPVAVLAPLSIIALISLIDYLKAYRAEKKEEQMELESALAAAGIDKNDEKAVLMFTEKERYRQEIAEELERSKEEERKRFEKELKKKKKDPNFVDDTQELIDNGIDPSDIRAVTIYREKKRYRAELLQEEKEKKEKQKDEKE